MLNKINKTLGILFKKLTIEIKMTLIQIFPAYIIILMQMKIYQNMKIKYSRQIIKTQMNPGFLN